MHAWFSSILLLMLASQALWLGINAHLHVRSSDIIAFM